MKGKLSKFILGVTIPITMVGGFLLGNYCLHDKTPLETLSSLMNNNLLFYTSNNFNSFIPMEIDRTLKEGEFKGKMKTLPFIYGLARVDIPVPDVPLKFNHGDTAFALDGSFYCALSTYEEDNDTEGSIVRINKLGRYKPVIVEVRIPKSDAILYVQCYSPEAYNFYANYDWSSINWEWIEKDIGLSVTPESIGVLKERPKVSDNIFNIVNKFECSNSGYREFSYYDNMDFCSYRVMGELDRVFVDTYLELCSLDYSFNNAYLYEGCYYLLFDEVTVVVKSITINSSLIYYFD